MNSPPITRFAQARRAATLALTALLVIPGTGQAVTDVNPNGVNVRSSGASTVFLTFQNVGANETSSDAFWCGQLNATGQASRVTATDPCVPGTVFGRLPRALDQAQRSGTGGVSNLTDIMTIPASVARRAYQDAAAGGNGTFFYVRRFDRPGGRTFVRVTCRMAGGGARAPLALTRVELNFETNDGKQAIARLPRGALAPQLEARIQFNGSGRLKGRWEIVRPADNTPTPDDLLTEASLPIEDRARQQRWPTLGRFDLFLPPTGRATIPGPDPATLPTDSDGVHLVLLRIEASTDKEGDSNTVSGVVSSGGVAGFPMPVLRYVVGHADHGTDTLYLLSPDEGSSIADASRTEFRWTGLGEARYYLLEIESPQSTGYQAIIHADRTTYPANEQLMEAIGPTYRWRVSALDAAGQALTRTPWRNGTRQSP